MFADGTQLSHSESPDNYSDSACSLQNCDKDIGLWMEENKFKLNSDNTEAIRFSASSSVNTTIQRPHAITLSDTQTEFSGIFRNLDFIFDINLPMKQHIIKTC